jgi:S1-C subfamily serine protease
VVTDVQGGSDADRSGLRRGDVIVQADGRPARGPDDVTRALRDRSALLRVRRSEGAFFTILGD